MSHVQPVSKSPVLLVGSMTRGVNAEPILEHNCSPLSNRGIEGSGPRNMDWVLPVGGMDQTCTVVSQPTNCFVGPGAGSNILYGPDLVRKTAPEFGCSGCSRSADRDGLGIKLGQLH